MHFEIIDFGSPSFDELVALRDLVLRKPLGMQFHPKDISEEYSSIHLAAYDQRHNLLATLVLKPQSDTLVKMRQVAVMPTIQGKGIGRKLVIESEKISLRHGFLSIELHARATAVPFYKALDYHVVGDLFQEVGIDHYKMVKSLTHI